MNLVIFYLILSMIGCFITGLKQLKIISRVTKSKHLFDSSRSSNNIEAEKRSEDPLLLQILSKLNTIQIGVNEINNTLDNHTKIWELNEPIFDQMNYLYERARAEEFKSYRAR